MLKNPAEAQKRLSEGGRNGGSAQVPKGFAKLTPKRRREIARNAAKARWGKK